MKVIFIKKTIFKAIVLMLIFFTTFSLNCTILDVSSAYINRKLPIYSVQTTENKLAISFDAAWGADKTQEIMDICEDYGIKATFFLVGNYLEKCPEIVKQIVEDGHTVGNHTYHHKDMELLTSEEEFLNELIDLENLYKQIVLSEMPKFYRPPQGKYTEQQLEWAKKAGYKTCFWSLAYVDWDEKKQPSKEEAMNKLTERIHPGAIVLLHSTSSTNAEIMDEIIKKWKEMGYEFGELKDL